MSSDSLSSGSLDDTQVDRMLRTAVDGEPSADMVAGICRQIERSLKPVKPLPSDAVLIAICIGAFVLLTFIAAVPVGFLGFKTLGMYQKVVLYSIVLTSAGLLSAALVNHMIPGSKRRIHPALAVLFPLIAFAIGVPLLFPDFSMDHFVSTGYPCLRLGSSCAIPAGALTWLFLRQGWVSDPLPAALTAGALSGVVGIAVLSLHCPIMNAAHVMVWHLAVDVVAIGAGALAGWAIARFHSRS